MKSFAIYRYVQHSEHNSLKFHLHVVSTARRHGEKLNNRIDAFLRACDQLVANVCVEPAIQNRVRSRTADSDEVTSDKQQIEFVRLEIHLRREVNIDVKKIPRKPSESE